MNSFDPNYIDLFRRVTALSNEACVRLVDKISTAKIGSVWSPELLSDALSAPLSVIEEVVEAGIALGIFDYIAPICGECLNEINVGIPPWEAAICNNCGSKLPIYKTDFLILKNGRVPALFNERFDNSIRDMQAEYFASYWDENKSFIYFTIDLASSQKIQEKSDGQYLEFLKLVRQKVARPALLACTGGALFLGENGDEFKFGFYTIEVALKFVEGFFTRLERFCPQLNWYLPNTEDETFPRFNAFLGTIGKPTDQRNHQISARNLLFKTLNGAWDINHQDITHLYRISSVSRPLRKDYRVSLLVFNEALEMITAIDESWKDHAINKTVPSKYGDIPMRAAIKLYHSNNETSFSEDLYIKH